MLLDVLDDPDLEMQRWLRFGGLQTLASYRISRPTDDLDEARDLLAEKVGAKIIDWMRAMPLIWQSGNVCVAHAGGNPGRPIGEQSQQALVWGHPDFGRIPRQDGIWMARGHVIVEEANAVDGVISTDTGAYATGRLTAADISSEGVRFLTS